MSAAALRAPLPGPRPLEPREAALWVVALAFAVAFHLGLAWVWIARAPSSASAPEQLPAVQIDMTPPAAAPSDLNPSPKPAEATPESAAPDPVMEDLPEVPVVDVPPPPPEPQQAVEAPTSAAEAVAPPIDLPVPPPPIPAVVPPNPAVVLPPPPKKVEGVKTPVKTPPPVVRQPLDIRPPVARRPAEPARPTPQQAQRQGERRIARTPPQEAAGARVRAAAPVQGGAASAASSAAWRSRLVAYLQSRLRYPPGATSTGAAGVAFAVNRGGQVLSASLSRSSGNPTLDAAALAAVRGAVPPPPSDYVGSLSFNIPIRFSQR